MLDLHRALALVALVLTVDPAFADMTACNDPDLGIDATTGDLADMACTAATAAKALLVACGLVQTDPIFIEIVDTAQHPTFGDCMAVYDQRTGCLQVTDIARMPSLLPDDDARSALPPEVIFAATITHELAHALLQQSASPRQIAATEQEFVASAFEMQSLDPRWRDLLLQSHPVKPPGSLSLVHLSIYALDPRAFANNAWRVHDQEVMGCSLIRNIAEGKFRFPRH